MKIVSRIGVLGCLAACSVGLARADDTSWKILTDDPARSDFFYIMLQDQAKEAGQPVPSSSEAMHFALAKEFHFPDDTTFDDILNVERKDVIFGIDISHHTGPDISFDRLKLQNVRFVYAKATQGVGFKDGLFASYWDALGKLPPSKRVLRGAYHFLSSTGDPKDQAKSFLRLLDESGGLKAGDLPPVLDLEWDVRKGGVADAWVGTDPDEIIDRALIWLDYVEKNNPQHLVPIVYTARSWWRDRIVSEAKFARLDRYGIWIADYSGSARGVEIPAVPAKSPYLMWQFTENGKLGQGYKRKLDTNIYKGTDEQFLVDFQLKSNAP